MTNDFIDQLKITMAEGLARSNCQEVTQGFAAAQLLIDIYSQTSFFGIEQCSRCAFAKKALSKIVED